MKNMSRIFTILLVAVLNVIAACQSQATSPPVTTVPGAALPTKSPETTLPAARVISSPPSPSDPSEPTLWPTTVQVTPTLFSQVEETGEPGNPGIAHDPFADATVETIHMGKLSGIMFHPQRQTLFAVSDKGYVIEFEPDGTLVQRELVRKKADFEGVTCHPVTGLLYVAVEGDEVILEVNPDHIKVLRDILIDRVFDGGVLLDPQGNGVEDITFVPGGSGAMGGAFYLVNQSKELEGQDPSIVFEVEITGSASAPKATIVRYFSLGVTDLSGLYYDPSARRLLVISDDNDLLIETNLSGQILHTHSLLGVHQEGIAIDHDGFLCIAQDSKKSLLKFSPSEPTF